MAVNICSLALQLLLSCLRVSNVGTGLWRRMTFAEIIVTTVMTSFALVDVITCDFGVELEHVTSLKLPSYTEEEEPFFRFDSGSVRKMAYDSTSQLLYVIGGNTIHYINVSDPRQLRIIGHTSLPDVTFFDIQTCGDHVLATYSLFNESGLLVARGYNPAYNFPVILLQIVYDAPDPVALAVTSDCKTAVVAISGKASWDGKAFMDRQPAVLLISIPDILARGSTRTEAIVVIDFRDLDDSYEYLVKEGIRFPTGGRVGRFSQDLDPSDVTIDDITRKAYVSLQVNNAVVEIDLLTKNLSSVTSLGLKDWRYQDIDVSNEDGGSLEFTIDNGLDNVTVGKMTKFVTFGARSFSLRDLDLDLVYDSGSDVERIMAQREPDVFNCPVKEGSRVPRYDRDLTSVLMGPEPSSVTSGKLEALTLVFVGLNNPGGVLVYSLTLRDNTPSFQSMWLGLPDALKSWDELYMETNLAGIGVTDLLYVPSHVTRTGFPWLLVAGSHSGTVTLLKVKATGAVPSFSTSAGLSPARLVTLLFNVVLVLHNMWNL